MDLGKTRDGAPGVDGLSRSAETGTATSSAVESSQARDIGLLVLVSILAAVAFYLPFWARAGPVMGVPFDHDNLSVVQRHWDGPFYAVVAKTFYGGDGDIYDWWSKPQTYYAAHFPAYPAVIKVLSYPLGFLNAMLLANVLISTGATVALYLFLRRFNLSQQPFWVALAFIFLPARWFIYRYSGASEPLFLLLLIMSMYFYKGQRYYWCGALTALAMLTRSVGVLLYVVYLALALKSAIIVSRQGGLTVRVDAEKLRGFGWLLVPPMALLGLGLLFQRQYGDFFAYFHTEGLVGLYPTPFRTLSIYGTWSEGSIYIYLLTGLGLFLLYRKGYHEMFLCTLAFYIPTLFLAHHDVARYILPAVPFGLFVAYESMISSVPFRIMLAVMVVAVYIFAWSSIYDNLAPVGSFEQLEALLSSR